MADDTSTYPPLEPDLPPETWGDRYNRAYRIFRDREQLVLSDVCERLTDAGIPAHQPVLQRFAGIDRIPYRHASRIVAWGSLICYGFDPGAWGLDDDTVNLRAFDRPDIDWFLHPSTWGDDYRARRAERLGDSPKAANLRARRG